MIGGPCDQRFVDVADDLREIRFGLIGEDDYDYQISQLPDSEGDPIFIGYPKGESLNKAFGQMLEQSILKSEFKPWRRESTIEETIDIQKPFARRDKEKA